MLHGAINPPDKCLYGTMNPIGMCDVPSKSLLLVLRFERPIIYKSFNISSPGRDYSLKSHVRAMTPSYAVIDFDGYPSGYVLDVRTEN